MVRQIRITIEFGTFCWLDLQCWRAGSCEEDEVLDTLGPISDETECLEACQDAGSCDWFTYDASAMDCMLLARLG